ncbi:MAG: ferrous iron transport protein A [Asgard group archaeon]|nr:ferrous iron transport protein A [Asgard group archaeon]
MTKSDTWNRQSNSRKLPAQHGTEIPLIDLPVGKKGIINSVKGGRRACQRLNELGLIVGATVEMVNKINRGPVMIRVKGSKLALGRGLAMKVFVQIT